MSKHPIELTINSRRHASDVEARVSLADFLRGVETGTPAEPTFRTALQTQKVCDAVLASARLGQWAETGVG